MASKVLFTNYFRSLPTSEIIQPLRLIARRISINSVQLLTQKCAQRVGYGQFLLCKLSTKTPLNYISSASESIEKSNSILRELCFDQQVVRLVLNAQKHCNVLSLELMDTLIKELKEINNIQKLRAVILAAKGPAFSAGHDLKELTTKTGLTQHKLIFQRCTELVLLIQSMSLPVIAEVNGVVAAAGCQLVSSCDIVVASKNSKFMLNGSRVGIFCSTPGIPMSRNVPRKVAFDMLLTGRAISGQEALQAGLVSRLVAEPNQVEAEALKVAESILGVSRSVAALGKAFFYTQLDTHNFHHALRF